MGKYTTVNDIKKYIESNSSCKYIPESYQGADKKVGLVCECGNIFYMIFSSVKRTVKQNNPVQCAECCKSRRSKNASLWDTNSAGEYLKSIGSELIGEYVTERKGKCLIRCFSCGIAIYKSWGKIRRGQIKCPDCARPRNPNPLINKTDKKSRNTIWNIESVKQYVLDNTECTVVSDFYRAANINLDLKCHCGKLFSRRFDGIRRAVLSNDIPIECPECSNCVLWTEELLSDYISKNTNSILKKRGEYKNNRSSLTLICECGKRYKSTLHSIQASIRNKYHIACSGCKVSSGEKLVGDLLDDLGLDYEREKTYEGLVGIGGRKLRYDFAVKRDEKIFCLIEYDGRQHFEPIEVWGGLEALDKTIERDRRKNDYANNVLNIPIARIPYWKSEEDVRGIIKTLTGEVIR